MNPPGYIAGFHVPGTLVPLQHVHEQQRRRQRIAEDERRGEADNVREELHRARWKRQRFLLLHRR